MLSSTPVSSRASREKEDEEEEASVEDSSLETRTGDKEREESNVMWANCECGGTR